MFAYYFPPEDTTGAQRPFRFAKYLCDHGYQAHVITASTQEGGSPWPDVTHVPSAVGTRFDTAIERLAPYNDQLPWVSRAIHAAERAVTHQRPVAIISTSPPIAAHFAALATKRRHSLPWIADFRDPILGNPFRTRRWAKPYDYWTERTIVAQADAVIANTDTSAENLKRRHPRWSEKIHLIWNGYDPEVAIGAAPIPARRYKVLLHAGSIYGERHPNMLYASIERLIEQRRLEPGAVRVRLIGDMDPNWLPAAESRFAGLHGTGCIEYLNQRVPQREALREMAQADYLLLLDLNAMNAALQVPAKLFDYVRIGRPILTFTPNDSPTERILRKSGVPHACIYPGIPAPQADERLESFLKLPSRAEPTSRWFREQFDGAAQTQTLSGILEKLVPCPSTI